jgi:hypothetical protein
VRDEELSALTGTGEGAGRYRDAADILDALVLNPEFVEFLTFPAYDFLD